MPDSALSYEDRQKLAADIASQFAIDYELAQNIAFYVDSREQGFDLGGKWEDVFKTKFPSYRP